MMLVRSSLKYSPIHGLGCFAEEDIKAGQQVWRLDPRVDLEFNLYEVEAFPEAFRDFLNIYAYRPINGPKDIIILCGDHGRHMNHSDHPNLLEAGTDDGLNFAARDIKAGEELTCDYTAFDQAAQDKLTHK